MIHLGVLQGSGRVILAGDQAGEVSYDISVWQEDDGGLESARGSLNGSMELLQRIFDVGGADLELAEGGTIQVVAMHWDASEKELEVVVSGPVPGF